MTQRHDELNTAQTVRELLNEVALERDLRQSTVVAYRRCLTQLGVLELPVSAVTKELVVERAWKLANPNTRRNAIIAARTVFGFSIKIPRSIPRRYTLPSEDTLRLAVMTSPFETRALLMMYAGCRLGEACAVSRDDLSGDRLRIDKQVQVIRETGLRTITRIAAVKTREADVVIPAWLGERIQGLTGTDSPDAVRESLRRAGQRVGVLLTPTELRHWYITELIARGIPLELVRKQARHSDLSVTLTYYQEHDSAMIHDIFQA